MEEKFKHHQIDGEEASETPPYSSTSIKAAETQHNNLPILTPPPASQLVELTAAELRTEFGIDALGQRKKLLRAIRELPGAQSIVGRSASISPP